MALYNFGSGDLYAVRTDVTGATPRKFGTLQDVSVSFSASSKELYGQYQFPVAVARGKAKIDCKAKLAQIQAGLFNDIFFGGSVVAGQVATAVLEAAAVPGSGPFTYQVANHATFVTDLGVSYAATGLPLALVANNPAQGQYSVNAGTGTYTFAAADASAAVLVNYEYTQTGGNQITLANPKLGSNPVFEAVLTEGFESAGGPLSANLTLYACVSSKLSLDAKQEDWAIHELDFSAMANAAGNVFNWSFSQNG